MKVELNMYILYTMRNKLQKDKTELKLQMLCIHDKCVTFVKQTNRTDITPTYLRF